MTVLEARDTIIFKVYNNGKIVEVSKNIEKILGNSFSELKDKFIWDILIPNNKFKNILDFEKEFLNYNEFCIKSISSEFIYLKPLLIIKNNKNLDFVFYNITEIKKNVDNLKKEIAIKSDEYTNINNELLQINTLLIKEIYERKRAEEKLSYNYSLLENISDAIIATLNDKDRKIILCNRGAELIFGINKEDVIDLPFNKVLKFDFLNDSDREKYLNNPSGFKGELIYNNNNKKIILDANIIPIKNREDVITEWIAVYRDITYKKEFELKEKLREEQLIKSEKLASLGVLVSGIAHEINNPNNYVMLNSKMLKRFCEEIKPILDQYFKNNPELKLLNMPYKEAKDNLEETINGLIDGSIKIKNIIQSLKEFIQPDLGVWNQEVDVNSAVKTSIIILNNLIKKSTDYFFVEYDESIPKIKGNIQQLEQVIINLIVNACQSLTSKDKSITVSTHFDKKENIIFINIKDQGRGIPKEIIGRIIEPFFTTKIDSGGTGLGLSISYNIIRKFKGDIIFSSELNKGTTVTIKLPV